METVVRIQGIDHRVHAELIKGTLWVHHNGRTYTMDASSGQKSRRKSGAAGSSDQIVAPMPGKVTKILVQEGNVVSQGQAVLVMEAMKMEYTLKADIDGEIEVIHCSAGEQVALGKALVKIKPSADK
jgi:biotin carboxyl carrier protein